MSNTQPQLSLSPVYRHAQRALGTWLEQDQATARWHALRVRTALAALDPTERHRFARWLAWLCVTVEHRRSDLRGRINRLDGGLCRMVDATLATLPVSVRPGPLVSGIEGQVLRA